MMRRLWIVAALLSPVAAWAEDASADTRSDAIVQAKQAYLDAKTTNRDLSKGPCLGEIMEDWVADVVHNPRTAADDDPANQCKQVRNGDVSHFVELDVQGNVVRVK